MTWMEAYFHWRPLLIEALDGRYFNGEWLDCQVMSGRAVFLHDEHSSLIAEVKFYPTGATDVAVICAAGDARRMCSTWVPVLEEIANRNGSLAVIVDSRQAWARLLKGFGFEEYRFCVRKAS